MKWCNVYGKISDVRLQAFSGALLALALGACSAPPAPGPWEDTDYGRSRPLAATRGADQVGFDAVLANRSGIAFANAVTEQNRLENQLLTHGSGVAIGDVDGDDLPDLYLGRVDGSNALYRNLGDFRFEDITGASGTGLEGLNTTGVAMADVDGDGDLDLVVGARGQANALLLNDGTGTFTDGTAAAGIGSEQRGTTTLTLADVDGDGDLDLYAANYKYNKVGGLFSPRERTFDQVVRNVDGRFLVREEFQDFYRAYVEPEGIRLWQFGEPDEFYLNDGTGHFSELDWMGGRFLREDGLPLDSVPDEWALTARFHDANGDLLPDLYVSNDFESPDHFWINRGDGTFQSINNLAMRSTSASSMAVDFSDVDRDGEMDFFVVDMAPRLPSNQRTQIPQIAPDPIRPGEIDTRVQGNRNTLFLSDGQGGFNEIARAAGIEASGWSWSTHFLDADLDGYEDIVVTTGHVWDVLDADTNQRLLNTSIMDDWLSVVNQFPRLELGNVAYRNRGDGTFEDVSDSWGVDLGPDISHGVASGDLDGDGDLDVVMNRLGYPVAILRNKVTAPRISVTLRGEGGNSHGIGALVRLEGGIVNQSKEITSGGLYLSSAQPLASFAATGENLEIVVDWPSGRVSRIPAVAGRQYEIHEARATERRDPNPAGAAPAPALFEVAQLGHTHRETDFNDFERQSLLPHRLSQMGPGLTWLDADGDSDEDLLIPSGAGGRLALMRNDGGRFTRVDGPEAGSLDQTSVLPLPVGSSSLLIGQSIWEAPSVEVALATPGGMLASVQGGRIAGLRPGLPGSTWSVGPMSAADLDGDGSLEVFVGTRAVPLAYPQPVPSRIFRVQGGELVLDSVSTASLAQVGLISGTIFTDLDGDGDPDLVLAEDWGLIRVFINVAGRLSDVTQDWGLGALRGRWNGVNAGDFDGDGRMDLVVTSWGRNTRHNVSSERPLRLYWGDFDGTGGLDMIEAQPDTDSGLDFPTTDLAQLTTALPYIRRQQTRTFQEFSTASMEQVIGAAAFRGARVEDVVTLDHQLLMNRGGTFEAISLPLESQYAPAFHPAVADFDGDGNEDLFLSQNFFPNELNRQRYSSGRGMILLGDGAGRLTPMSPGRSGVNVFGDQRGAAVADYDGDGRIDLAVSQNGAETILLRNVTAQPGVRVRVRGPAGNPRAVGTRMRVVRGDGSFGPTREIHLGAGYWSVNGEVQVLGRGGEVSAIEFTFPDGSVITQAVVGEDLVEVRWNGR